MNGKTREAEVVLPSTNEPVHNPGNQGKNTPMTSSNLAESERTLKIPLAKNHSVIGKSRTHGITIHPNKGGGY
jgi:hypothetical protein